MSTDLEAEQYKEGPSLLNNKRYASHKNKVLKPYPGEGVSAEEPPGKLALAKGRTLAVVPVPEDSRQNEMTTRNIGKISLNGKTITQTVSGQLERYRQQQNIKRRIRAGLPTKEEEAAAKEGAEAEKEEGKVNVDIKEEKKVPIEVNFTLDQEYIDAIKVPDTYFNIITSVKTS
jgi:hypothetical protein